MKTWVELPAALLVALGPAIVADDDPETVTDMEFLEYLGSWDESDDEWLLFEEAVESNEDDADDKPDTEDENDDET